MEIVNLTINGFEITVDENQSITIKRVSEDADLKSVLGFLADHIFLWSEIARMKRHAPGLDLRNAIRKQTTAWMERVANEQIRAFTSTVSIGFVVSWDDRSESIFWNIFEQWCTQKYPETGYVYLLQSPTGAYKIGKTKNPDDRMKTFGVKLPFEVSYTCVISSEMYAQLERELHERYAEKRLNGEWFALTINDVAEIKAMRGVTFDYGGEA